jgi:hypothetical protein
MLSFSRIQKCTTKADHRRTNKLGLSKAKLGSSSTQPTAAPGYSLISQGIVDHSITQEIVGERVEAAMRRTCEAILSTNVIEQ